MGGPATLQCTGHSCSTIAHVVSIGPADTSRDTQAKIVGLWASSLTLLSSGECEPRAAKTDVFVTIPRVFAILENCVSPGHVRGGFSHTNIFI